MSTFFEKLTGGRVKSDTANSSDFINPVVPVKEEKAKEAVKKDEPRRAQQQIQAVSTQQSTHLKVATDDATQEEKKEEAEEEGELAVDIYDKGDVFVIQSTVAGVKPEDLDVAITNDTVTVRGKRAKIEEVEEKNYYYKELFWGTFARSVILPEEIEEDMAEANLKNGLLSIRLPKKKKGVVQKLKVKVS